MNRIMQMHPRSELEIDYRHYDENFPDGYEFVYDQPEVKCGSCLQLLVAEHHPTVLEFGSIGYNLIISVVLDAGIFMPTFTRALGCQLILSPRLTMPPRSYLEEGWAHLNACPRYTDRSFGSHNEITYQRPIVVNPASHRPKELEAQILADLEGFKQDH